MQDEEWAHNSVDVQEIVEEFDLDVGGLVGAVASIDGTGRLITGTRNDEPGLDASASGCLGNRLTVHSIRDTQGRVLGLGPRQLDERGEEVVGGWEPVAEAWTAHEGAVTGIDVVADHGNLGDVSGVVTSGGDGCLRLFQLTMGNDSARSDSEDAGPCLDLQGEVAAHAGERAVGVAATRRRAVTVGEDGMASVVDLQRLVGGGGGGGGVGGDSSSVIWRGKAKGALPLSGVTFNGESEEVFATAGCDPRGQLMIWDTRAQPGRPVATFGCFQDSGAPYLCVSSQPFNSQVFACGVSTGELLVWDTRAKWVVHELKNDDRDPVAAGTWGVAFHPRRPSHLFSCTGTGSLSKWYLPTDGQRPPSGNNFGGPTFGGSQNGGWGWEGRRELHALPSRSALVGVCYDEGADTVSAVSKHGHVVVAQGVKGMRL